MTETKNEAVTKEVKTQPEWNGTFEDVTNHQRAFKITESDGTTIEVPFNWPGRTVAENLDGLSYGSINGVLRDTPGTYHEALLDLFGTPKVAGKVHEPLDMKFFEDAANQSDRNKTFDYLMDNGESFLKGKLN
ncbi:hypothetical protein LEBR102806_11895 [Levilactobacillus brevis]|uniref:Uncharacterized protein n=1 Tax=Levilactobacillus brevis ATCC 14869 = DSM 20054 TaxID=649758 RepID=U2PKN1_LEVBR|nr:hypothetical protein [Levilactobacillus brevis]ERK44706.1 hypothetical protein HMPREF0495_00772 [Levilactobacillus brevis ATCC 14869 = DSM 20054]KRK21406.1 hypothetical protein FC61_GL000051 [Levilactobacillus brevis ATCC 14869 = DSM 20054]MCT3573115.1 hypothetical protein [Levilactobacillus brevis]SQG81295.1 Uncharacterised protein [Levilactobacillus brevis]